MLTHAKTLALLERTVTIRELIRLAGKEGLLCDGSPGEYQRALVELIAAAAGLGEAGHASVRTLLEHGAPPPRLLVPGDLVSWPADAARLGMYPLLMPAERETIAYLGPAYPADQDGSSYWDDITPDGSGAKMDELPPGLYVVVHPGVYPDTPRAERPGNGTARDTWNDFVVPFLARGKRMSMQAAAERAFEVPPATPRGGDRSSTQEVAMEEADVLRVADLPMFTLLLPERPIKGFTLDNYDVDEPVDEEGRVPWAPTTFDGEPGSFHFDYFVLVHAIQRGWIPEFDEAMPIALTQIDAYDGPRWTEAQMVASALRQGLPIAKLPDTLEAETYRWYVVSIGDAAICATPDGYGNFYATIESGKGYTYLCDTDNGRVLRRERDDRAAHFTSAEFAHEAMTSFLRGKRS